ncbi:MAG: hypothetical protein JSS66_06225 [Armatimonadetes bacterium]|nr:hypothetical protein [Armatimonadota bacterium]
MKAHYVFFGVFLAAVTSCAPDQDSNGVVQTTVAGLENKVELLTQPSTLQSNLGQATWSTQVSMRLPGDNQFDYTESCVWACTDGTLTIYFDPGTQRAIKVVAVDGNGTRRHESDPFRRPER